MDKGYTTVALVETYLGLDSGDITSTNLEPYILAAQQTIDGTTGRNFKADTTASARLYDGDGDNVLLIDDCIAVTKVENGLDGYGGSFQEVQSSGADRYFLEPSNYSVLSVPVTRIRLSARVFPCGNQNNRITAKWGYSENPPEDIKFAATVLAAGIYNYNRGGTGNVVSEKIGQYSVAYDRENANALADYKEVLKILERYTKITI